MNTIKKILFKKYYIYNISFIQKNNNVLFLRGFVRTCFSIKYLLHDTSIF